MTDRLDEKWNQDAIGIIGKLPVDKLEDICKGKFDIISGQLKAAEINPRNPLVMEILMRNARIRLEDASCIGDFFSIDALVNNGREFYSEQKDSNGHYIGLSVALQDAVNKMGSDGIIATMPYLIAGKAQAGKKNYLWKNWFTAFSEEYAGIDKNGKLVKNGESVVLIVHGGGILTYQRINQAYSEGLTPQYAAKLTEEEFNNLLNGILPSGKKINLYTVDDIKRGIPDSFDRYAVWMPAKIAKSKSSGYHMKTDFMGNELVIARAGTLEYLDAYFEKAKHPSNNYVGNWHRFGEIDFHQPKGRVLFVGSGYDGLYGNDYLYYGGRFVGVAPEAQGMRKNSIGNEDI